MKYILEEFPVDHTLKAISSTQRWSMEVVDGILNAMKMYYLDVELKQVSLVLFSDAQCKWFDIFPSFSLLIWVTLLGLVQLDPERREAEINLHSQVT